MLVSFFVTDTMPPKFNISCPSVRKLTLPKSESTIFHTWDIPVATDNSGIAPVVTSHPNISSPRMLNLGTTNITYKAMDSSKNNATCLVSFVVEGKGILIPAFDAGDDEFCF